MSRPSLSDLPLVAILRGVQPDEIVPMGQALFQAGFRWIEIPLNSPHPFESIRRLALELGSHAHIGAGTVLHPSEVDQVAAVGGTLIFSPNTNPEVIRHTVATGLLSVPGVATPTEGFLALEAGAHALKLFPAEQIPPAIVKAWRAVFPKTLPLLPVGGITPETMAPYYQAGASGFGLGSALYQPGMTPDTVAQKATAFVSTWRALTQPSLS